MLSLDPGENLILEVHRHWYVLAAQALVMFVLAIAPLVFSSVISRFAPVHLSLPAEEASLKIFFYCLWLLILWVSFFVIWTNYYLDVWYVTDKRIISIDQVGVFHRKVSNIRFDSILDVSIEMRGAVQTLLKFGDIHIKTAIEQDKDFLMKNASNPDRVRKVIFDYHNITVERTRPTAVEDDSSHQQA